MTFIGMLRH